MSLSDLLFKRMTNDGETKPRSHKMQALQRGRGVGRTSEFARIANLRRRVWSEAALADAAEGLTEHLRTPDGTMKLWPLQAAALVEMHDCEGTVATLRVGGGKALLSLLAPVVLDAERPLLLVPADLREQTKRVIPEMRKHWRLHPSLVVLGYSELSLAKNGEKRDKEGQVTDVGLLERMAPDVIMLDEAQAVKNPGSARTRRLRRYLAAHPETKVLILSGTLTKRSLLDFHHVLGWTHGPNHMPLPSKWQEVQAWALAVDEGVPDENCMGPGALLDFCTDGENVRQGLQRRLFETPGVITSGDDELGVSLVLNRIDHKPGGAALAFLGKLRSLWEGPNGEAFTEAVDIWRCARQLALGFWYQWDPGAPRDWLDARREWSAHVRDTLKHNRRGLDSPLQVWNECAEQDHPPSEWVAWRDVKDTFKPNTIVEWIDHRAVYVCAEWLRERRGICWVEHVAFGRAVAKEAGVPYFGAGTKASAEILDASGPIVASVAAHGKGKNLQHGWSRNLVTCPPSSGEKWEQLIGRTHREGQTADEVSVDVIMGTDEATGALRQAYADARYVEDVTGARQKLNYADRSFEL